MWQICVEGLHELPSLLPGLCRCFSYFTTFKKIYNAILGQKIILSALIDFLLSFKKRFTEKRQATRFDSETGENTLLIADNIERITVYIRTHHIFKGTEARDFLSRFYKSVSHRTLISRLKRFRFFFVVFTNIFEKKYASRCGRQR